MSCAIQTFFTSTTPVSSSASTSTTGALYEYAGEGPTPAPRKRPADGGGVYEPTVPRVPHFASPSTAASANVIEVFSLVGSDASKTRLPAKTSRLCGTP